MRRLRKTPERRERRNRELRSFPPQFSDQNGSSRGLQAAAASSGGGGGGGRGGSVGGFARMMVQEGHNHEKEINDRPPGEEGESVGKRRKHQICRPSPLLSASLSIATRSDVALIAISEASFGFGFGFDFCIGSFFRFRSDLCPGFYFGFCGFILVP
ncbi:hypothetical protein Dimus_033789, partial [Dionaea muscipula]